MKPTSVRQCNRHSQPCAFARTIALVSALCALAFFANVATADPVTYILASTGDWNDENKWSPVGVPTSADTVLINSSRTATIDSGDSGAADLVRVGYGSSQNGTLKVNGSLTTEGTVTVAWSNSELGPSRGTIDQNAGSSVAIGGNLTIGHTHSRGTGGGVYTVADGASLIFTGASSSLDIGLENYGRGTFNYNNTLVPLIVPGNVRVGHKGYEHHDCYGTFNQGANTTVNIKGNLTLGYQASGIFNQGANTTVKVDGILTVGSLRAYATTAYTVPETGKLTVGSLNIATGGRNSRGTFTYNGTVAPLVVTGNVGIASGHEHGLATGTFNQGTNSDVAIGGSLTIGSTRSNTGNGGVYNLADGASVTVTGATAIATASYSRGRLNINGGTANLSTLSMGADGTIEGYGTVSGTTLTMNGTVRASGGTLDLTGFSSIVNASGTGWFVKDGGAITLPTTTVAAGNSSFTWGARAAAVNSVQLAFTNVAGGVLSITVLDPDTDSYLPGFGTGSPTTGSIVSLWEIDGSGGFAFGDGSVNMVFRYDHTRLDELGIGDESLLKVYHHNGIEWELLDTTIDTTLKTASVTGVTSFSPFAVGINISGGIIPEPASLVLLGLAGGALMLRRRRRA